MGVLKKILFVFMNFRLSRKLLWGYFIIIVLPYIVISVFFYNRTSSDVTQSVALNDQSILYQEYSNLNNKISLIESFYKTFQYNPAVYNYMSDSYLTVGDEMYSYLSEISPLFDLTKSGNKGLIDDVLLFKEKRGLVNLENDIVDISMFDQSPLLLMNNQVVSGYWYFDKSSDRYEYFHSFLNERMTSSIGYFKIEVSADKLLQGLSNSNGCILLVDDSKNIIFKKGATDKMEVNDTNDYQNSKSYYMSNGLIYNILRINKLNASLIMITPLNAVINNGPYYTYLAYIVITLIVLSVFYYLLASSISSRITKFALHIKEKCHNDQFVEYPHSDYEDEIGLLINIFNSMIFHINDLIDRVYKTEIARKEAKFDALQAQIMPHFIYNTLECIRMSAESSKSKDAAHMAYKLGKLLRYNVENREREVLISEEIANIMNLLELYKLRKEDQFEFIANIGFNLDDYICPFFILQPIVENCIMHGFKNLRGKGYIWLDVNLESESAIVLRISDNGLGIESERLSQINASLKDASLQLSLPSINRRSVGIYNINERIKNFFGEKYGLTLESVSCKGVVCIIRIGAKKRKPKSM